MADTAKAKARQSRNHAARYTRQHERTAYNKLLRINREAKKAGRNTVDTYAYMIDGKPHAVTYKAAKQWAKRKAGL